MDSPQGVHVVTLVDERFKDTAFGKLARIRAKVMRDRGPDGPTKDYEKELYQWNHTYLRNRWSQQDHEQGLIPQHLLIAHNYGRLIGVHVSAVVGCTIVKTQNRDRDIVLTLKNLLQYAEGLNVPPPQMVIHMRLKNFAADDDSAAYLMEDFQNTMFPDTLLYKTTDLKTITENDPIVDVLFGNLKLYRVWVRNGGKYEPGLHFAMENHWSFTTIDTFDDVARIVREERAGATDRLAMGEVFLPMNMADKSQGTHYLRALAWTNVAVWGDKTEFLEKEDSLGSGLIYGARMTGVVATSLPYEERKDSVIKKILAYKDDNAQIGPMAPYLVPVYGASGSDPPALEAVTIKQEGKMASVNRDLDDPYTTIYFDAMFEIPPPPPQESYVSDYTKVKGSVSRMRFLVNNAMTSNDEKILVTGGNTKVSNRARALWLAARAIWLRDDVTEPVVELTTKTGMDDWPEALIPSFLFTPALSYRFTRLFLYYGFAPFEKEISQLGVIEDKAGVPSKPTIPAIVIPDDDEGGSDEEGPSVPPPVPPPVPQPVPTKPQKQPQQPVAPINVVPGTLLAFLNRLLDPTQWLQALNPGQLPFFRLPASANTVYDPPTAYEQITPEKVEGLYSALGMSMAQKSTRAGSAGAIDGFSIVASGNLGSDLLGPLDQPTTTWQPPTRINLGRFGAEVLGIADLGTRTNTIVIGWANRQWRLGKSINAIGNRPAGGPLRVPAGAGRVFISVHFRGDRVDRTGTSVVNYDTVVSPSSGMMATHLEDDAAAVVGIMGGHRVSDDSFEIDYFFVRIITPNRV